MTDEQVCETVEKYGANREECARLNASLSCLRNVHTSGKHEQSRRSGLSPAGRHGPSRFLCRSAHQRVDSEKPARAEIWKQAGLATLQRMAHYGSWVIRALMWEPWKIRVSSKPHTLGSGFLF